MYSVVLSIFVTCCKHHQCTELFHHLRQKLYSFNNNSPPLSPTAPPQLLVSSVIPSVSVNSLILSNLYKWNYTVFVLLCLTSLTYLNILKVHATLWMDHILFIHLLTDTGVVSTFHLLWKMLL